MSIFLFRISRYQAHNNYNWLIYQSSKWLLSCFAPFLANLTTSFPCNVFPLFHSKILNSTLLRPGRLCITCSCLCLPSSLDTLTLALFSPAMMNFFLFPGIRHILPSLGSGAAIFSTWTALLSPTHTSSPCLCDFSSHLLGLDVTSLSPKFALGSPHEFTELSVLPLLCQPLHSVVTAWCLPLAPPPSVTYLRAGQRTC